MKSIIIFLSAFAASYLLVPVFKSIAKAIGVVDVPNSRKLHKKPIPLLGGSAIFFTFAIGLIVLKKMLLIPAEYYKVVYALLISGSFMFIIGLIDDMYGMRAKLKLFFELLAVGVLILFEVSTDFFTGNLAVTIIITVIWGIGITNAFNLLDNMNGLSSGVAFISAALFYVVGAYQGDSGTAYAALLLAGAILGFWPYNYRKKAHIFMGDAGSLFLGITFTAISAAGVYLKHTRLNHLPIITPIIILSMPIFDTLSVMYIRKKQGISILTADKQHLSHRLTALGFNNLQAVALIYLITIAAGISAIFLPQLNLSGAILVIIQVLAMYAILVILMFFGHRTIEKVKDGNSENEVKQ